MYKWKIWARINEIQTTFTTVWADTAFEAKAIAESQFGAGNVLNYTRIDE